MRILLIVGLLALLYLEAPAQVAAKARMKTQVLLKIERSKAPLDSLLRAAVAADKRMGNIMIVHESTGDVVIGFAVDSLVPADTAKLSALKSRVGVKLMIQRPDT